MGTERPCVGVGSHKGLLADRGHVVEAAVREMAHIHQHPQLLHVPDGVFSEGSKAFGHDRRVLAVGGPEAVLKVPRQTESPDAQVVKGFEIL